MDERHHEAFVELLPAYVLGSLDADDQQVVEGYLAVRPDARRELEELRETLGLLAFAAPPLAAPPGAKAALLARIEVETAVASEPAIVPTPVAPAAPAPTKMVSRPRAWRWRMALAAVAAALLLALAVWNVALQRQLGAQAEQAEIGRLLSEQRFARPLLAASSSGDYGSSGPSGFTYLDPQGDLALINCYWMPTLRADQVYQVWLLRPDGKRDNGGTFTVDAHGNASVIVRAPENFGSYTSLGVTAEPAPGSAGPTSQRVIWVDLH